MVRCSGRNRDGDPCGRPPIRGGTVCASHGGRAPQVRAAADRRLAELEIRAELGVPLDVDALEAIVGCVQEAAGNVATLRAQVGELGADLWITDGQGRRHLHPAVQLYGEERDRLVRVSYLALMAKVDERRVRLAGAHARLLGEAFARALDRCDLTPTQRDELRSALAGELRAVTAAPPVVNGAGTVSACGPVT